MKIDRLAVFNKYGQRCAYCGDPITMQKMQVDHIHPVNNGGTDDFDNLNPSCFSCNNRKSTLDLETFKSEISKQVVRLRRDSGAFRLAERFGLIHATGNDPIFYFETRAAEIGRGMK